MTSAGTPAAAAFHALGGVSGVEPFPVTFVNDSTGTATIKSFWSFGDGGAATNTDLSNVANTYYAAGSPYTVTLIASNALGWSTSSVPNMVSVITAYQSWTNHYGLTGASAAGTADPDGDGVNNNNEFAAGFNPINPGAYPHIIKIVKSGSDMNVTYLGASGDNTWSPGYGSRTNILEFTTGGPTGNYSNNFATAYTSTGGGTSILSGGSGIGTVVTVTDAGGATGATRYYRIRVIAP